MSYTRLRRCRDSKFIRDLLSENVLLVSDLIYPIFVVEDGCDILEVSSMPGQIRFRINDLPRLVEEVINLGIRAVAIFPVVPDEKKSLDAMEALNPEGLIQRAIGKIKFLAGEELGIITDLALDPYTTHGHDGLLDEKGYVINDLTAEFLAKQALSHAGAGADIVAPSDMMDGRVKIIRSVLDSKGFINTKILSYSAKFASCFYGPFRDMVGSRLREGNKKSYQLDPANSREALREIEEDVKEGADMVMIKPAMMYSDIICRVRERFDLPVFSYQVSGEYLMLKLAISSGILDEKLSVLESLLSLKRAGSDGIISYFALDAAKFLKDGY